mmetsp:Transcript_3926/g.5291  ORF Transcript_3926/g.5291 Transcript_3926/m.5291 type:complete len:171 (+) Transcript_3926:164-676(+)
MEDLWDNTDPTLESSTHTKVSSDSTVLFLFSTKYHHHHHSVIPPIMSYSFMISNIFHPTWAYLIYYNQQHAVTEMDTFSSLAKKVRISSLIPHSFDLLSSHSSLLQPALMIELDAPLNISWKHIFLYSTISKTFQHFLFIIGQNANTFLQLFTQEKHEQISKHGEQKWSV